MTSDERERAFTGRDMIGNVWVESWTQLGQFRSRKIAVENVATVNARVSYLTMTTNGASEEGVSSILNGEVRIPPVVVAGDTDENRLTWSAWRYGSKYFSKKDQKAGG